jgi:hypothetical protein
MADEEDSETSQKFSSEEKTYMVVGAILIAIIIIGLFVSGFSHFGHVETHQVRELVIAIGMGFVGIYYGVKYLVRKIFGGDKPAA